MVQKNKEGVKLLQAHYFGAYFGRIRISGLAEEADYGRLIR